MWIKDEFGLSGQVIINGKNASGATTSHWSGEADMRILPETSHCPKDVISKSYTPDTAFRAPFYSNPSDDLGGGAVGLVPYRLYNGDCDPPHFNDWRLALDNATWPTCAEPLLLSSRFNGPITTPSGTLPQQSATIRFYGPVYTDAPDNAPIEEQPYIVWYYLNASPLIVWADVTEAFTVQVQRGGGSNYARDIQLSKNSAVSGTLREGFYAIIFNRNPRTSEHPRYPLLCDGTTAIDPPAVRTNLNAQAIYNFRLYPDCNNDGCIDATDHRCGDGPGCRADLDNDGDLSNGGNPDQAVDINDLLFFLAAFEAGDIAADMDNGSGAGYPDGGVDINDLLFFLARFEEGC